MSSYFERSLDLHVRLKHSYVIRVQQRVELHHELSQPPSWEHRVIRKRPEKPNGTKTPDQILRAYFNVTVQCGLSNGALHPDLLYLR